VLALWKTRLASVTDFSLSNSSSNNNHEWRALNAFAQNFLHRLLLPLRKAILSRGCTKVVELTATFSTSKFLFAFTHSRFSSKVAASSESNFRRVVEQITSILPPPKRLDYVRKASAAWKLYRTRFLIRAKQLTEPFDFVDGLGREHRGQKGDYLVESSDGTQRIAKKEIFEDIYVAMGPASQKWRSLSEPKSLSDVSRRRTSTGRAIFV